jgi:hypothetical protein
MKHIDCGCMDKIADLLYPVWRKAKEEGVPEKELVERCQGAMFCQMMRDAKLDRRRVCRILGMTEAGVALLEAGKAPFTTEMMLRIAKATGKGVVMHPF